MLYQSNLWALYFIFMFTAIFTDVQGQLNVDSLKSKLSTSLTLTEKVQIYDSLSEFYRKKNKYQLSSKYYFKALEINQKRQDWVRVAKNYNNISISLKHQQNYLLAIQYLNKALEINKKHSHKGLIAGNYYNLASIYKLQRNYDLALQCLGNSLEALKQEENLPLRFKVFRLMSKNYGFKGKYQKAIYFSQKALHILSALPKERKKLASIFQRLGVCHRKLGDYIKAQMYYLKGLKIAEQENFAKIKARIYNSLGIVYHQQQEYKKSLYYYQKYLASGYKYHSQKTIALAHNNMADSFLQLDSLEKAYKFYNLAIKKSISRSDQNLLVLAYLGLAELHQRKEKYQDAQRFIQKAMLKIVRVDDKSKAYYLLGENYRLKRLYSQALTQYKKAEKLQKSAGNLYLFNRTLQGISICYEKLGDSFKALNYHKLFKQTTDSLLNEKNIKTLTRLGAEYEFEKERDSLTFAQEMEKSQLNHKIKQEQMAYESQKKVIFFISAILLLVATFSFITYRGRLLQKKLNIQLSKQKKDLEYQSSILIGLNEELHQSQDEIAAQRDMIEAQNENLKAKDLRLGQSIKSAQKIQQAILPFDDDLLKIFPEHFVLYKPKDVVSGDFYWVYKENNVVFLAAVDCTGHGVPGAFMSMIGNTLLDHIIRIKREFNPAKILEHLHNEIYRVLRQQESKDRNGMDMALCAIQKVSSDALNITFAGAKRPLLYTTQSQAKIQELRGSFKSIGGLQPSNYSFANQQITLTPTDHIYLSSDGYCDQHSNQSRKSIGKTRFIELLQRNHHLPTHQQKKILENTLKKHMKGTHQRDDILVLGLKLNINWANKTHTINDGYLA
ncbi:hypothetical protein BKI52_28765 [marine bacterium AO1-C]|nr:hypothetical protein BKI52_28765 [marine bacterium AO1-C]